MLAWPLLLSLVAIEIRQSEGTNAPPATTAQKTVASDAQATPAEDQSTEDQSAEHQSGKHQAAPALADEGSPEGHLRVLNACQTALGEESCTLAPAPEASWQALVLLDGAQVTVTLSSGQISEVRQLQFSAADRLEQRQVAAGLLVAAMTAALERDVAVRSTVPPARSLVPSQNQPPTASQKEDAVQRRLSVQLGVLTQPILEWSHWGAGGTLGASLRLGARWAPAVDVNVLFANQDGLHALELAAQAGLDVQLTQKAPVEAWLGARGVFDWMEVNDRSAGSSSRSAWRGGGSVHATLLAPAGQIGAFLRGQLTLLGPPVEVLTDGRTPVDVPAWSFGAALGARFNH